MHPHHAAFVRRFALVACVGAVLTTVATRWISARLEPVPVFDFGVSVSVVAIRAPGGRFLQVTPTGMLRATAANSDAPAARFRVHVLSAATVHALKLAAAAAPPTAGTMTTISGCRCSGYSNEHGFGRFCHPWESDMQSPWCYVHAAGCPKATGGSFGLHHEECSLYGAEDGVHASWKNVTRGDEAYPAEQTDEAYRAGAGWVPPAACPCSGASSALGYGGTCRGWEFVGQTPWCYVFDNCTIASAGSVGSFGHRHLDCVLGDGPLESSDAPRVAAGRRLAGGPAAGPAAGRRLAASGPSADDADEASLLERVDRLRQPHVALVSLATEGFVTVERPPHWLAHRPHARTDALSLRGVLGFLPGRGILSLSSGALLNLCPLEPNEAEPEALAPVEAAGAAGAAGAPLSESGVCTSYFDEGDAAHPKLLRKPRPTSAFTVVHVGRELAEKAASATGASATPSKRRPRARTAVDAP